ncbi:MAG: Lrp/AsnC family transcriptional regulator [Syntrophales bacterium]
MLTETEKKISRLIQEDIALEKRPFKEIAERVAACEEQVLTTIRSLMTKGVVRKFGAILRHQRAGFPHNAMVIWAVPQERIEFAGQILASFKEVTHCYERTPPFAGKYNVFTMVHFGKGNQEGVIQKLSQETGIKDFKVLTSEEEYKKSSMEYFTDDQ